MDYALAGRRSSCPGKALQRSIPLPVGLGLCLLVWVLPLQAQELGGWGLSLGVFDVAENERTLEVGVDYRFSRQALGLIPVIGVGGTTDEAIFGYVGLRRDFSVGSRWLVIPSLAVVAYEEGDGKDLGGTLEFRSGLEAAYRLRNGSRLGVGYYHISNGGLHEPNPGVNSLLLSYTIPR